MYCKDANSVLRNSEQGSLVVLPYQRFGVCSFHEGLCCLTVGSGRQILVEFDCSSLKWHHCPHAQPYSVGGKGSTFVWVVPVYPSLSNTPV